MNTLTIELPNSLDPAVARWEMTRSLYEKGEITLEEAAAMVELTPAYFKIRIEKPFNPLANQVKQELLASAKPLNRQKFDQLVNQLDIQESWEDLASQIRK